jgi:antitoxin HicB
MKSVMKKENIGSSFDDWLREEGIYEQTTATAIKRVLARQIAREMTAQNLSKSEMAKRMQTSRAALDRLLDPANDAVTLNTIFKAASAVGRQINLELV